MSMQRSVVMAVLVTAFCLAGTSDAQLIIAHRGASHDAPENTVAAFRLAWEKAADGIEGDFYLTKDGHIVCIHDKTTKRTAPDQDELTVADSTLAELQRLDVGHWKNVRYARERIPTLEQVLQTVPELGIVFVEIKCGPEILPVLNRQLAESHLAPEQIVIICFDQEVVTQSRKLMPQYRANWLTSYKQESKDAPWTPSREEVLETLMATDATGLGSQAEQEVVDAAFVGAVHRRGEEFHVWTIDELRAARRFQRLGVDSITTNRPAFLRQGLQ